MYNGYVQCQAVNEMVEIQYCVGGGCPRSQWDDVSLFVVCKGEDSHTAGN
jgi:hypothetical protein